MPPPADAPLFHAVIEARDKALVWRRLTLLRIDFGHGVSEVGNPKTSPLLPNGGPRHL